MSVLVLMVGQSDFINVLASDLGVVPLTRALWLPVDVIGCISDLQKRVSSFFFFWTGLAM